MERRIDSTRVVLKRGDITRESVDAVVNAANSGLLGGGGVDGAIHRAGGPSILEECREIRARQGGCPTGEAVITGAGNLDARYVIHTVGPVWQGGGAGEEDLLRSAYRNSLALAAEHEARTVAFPSISTGAYGYPIKRGARTAIQAVKDWAGGNPLPEEVRFVLFSQADLEVYAEALAGLDET
jgi:O-acetyl-ADP-ribose deacetylase